MLDGKLRIAPTCYHILHLIPVMSAHEMGFFYDEGLKSFEDMLTEEVYAPRTWSRRPTKN